MNFNFIDSIMFVVVAFAVLYSFEAIDFTKLLKSSRKDKAFLFYMLVSLATIALVYLFYVFMKLLFFNF